MLAILHTNGQVVCKRKGAPEGEILGSVDFRSKFRKLNLDGNVSSDFESDDEEEMLPQESSDRPVHKPEPDSGIPDEILEDVVAESDLIQSVAESIASLIGENPDRVLKKNFEF